MTDELHDRERAMILAVCAHEIVEDDMLDYMARSHAAAMAIFKFVEDSFNPSESFMFLTTLADCIEDALAEHSDVIWESYAERVIDDEMGETCR